MCELHDFDDMDLLTYHRQVLEGELEQWHRVYLPIKGGTMLDIGAGCGETARFYLLHGAQRVLAIEGDPVAYAKLCKNFRGDLRVFPILATLSDIKIDIEGGEDGMTVEWHGPRKERTLTHSQGGLQNIPWVSRFDVKMVGKQRLMAFPWWHLKHYRERLFRAIGARGYKQDGFGNPNLNRNP